MTAATCAPPDRSPKRPAFQAPPGTTDAHIHIFGPESRYPWASTRTYTPPESTFEDYRKLMDVVGIQRVVVVQASPYGTDNSALLESVDRFAGAARGIVALDVFAQSDEQLAALTKRGVCGLRLVARRIAEPKMATLRKIAERIAPFGWHIQFQAIEAEDIRALAAERERLPVDVVLSKFGEYPAELPAVCELLKSGRAWVKLSHAYHASEQATPYPELAERARRLIAAASNRLVWGTDWPHPQNHGAMPNDGDLLDAFATWVTDPDLQRAILVDNSARLHGFPQ